ncbi:MAG: ABC transporter permease [Myxococcota bacterium]
MSAPGDPPVDPTGDPRVDARRGARGARAGARELGPGRLALRRLRRDRAATAGIVALALVAFACFGLPTLLALDPETTAPELHLRAPSADAWLGRDALGRDVLARVLVGGRTSLLVGVTATVASVVIGVLYGMVAGFYGGWIDEAMMRLVDFLYGLPYMFLVILIMLLFDETARGNPLPVFLALGLVQWLTMARIVRGETRALREREFVLAARTIGASDLRVLLRHVLPNLLGVISVYATLTVPSVILLESFLSFLGLGVALSWGRLAAEAVDIVNPIRSTWWLLAAPSAFLAVTLLALNFVGDGLRDALDPRSDAS